MPVRSVVRRARQRLGKVPLVRRLYDDVDLLLKYGTLRPERVPLAYSRHVIYANPREQRGRAILRGYGSGQRALKDIWRRAVEHLRPTIVVDVGANYGEFIFFTDYEPDALVLGVEADPMLFEYLKRSRQAHPHGDRIELVCALASDAPANDVPFYVDADWSGRSSALKQERHKNTRVEMVKSTTIDALVGDRARPHDRLLFKIDVEGFEPRVLGGMGQTLSTVGAAAGILEYNTGFLKKLGLTPREYVADLRRRFVVYLVDGNEPARELTEAEVEASPADVVADLVVSTKRDLLHAFVAGS